MNAEHSQERNERKVRVGTVVSAAMNKSIVIRIDSTKKHALYLKPVKISTKLYAHDEKNDARPGDVVRVMETRPLSKTKRWRLVEIVERAK
ncbi:MAG: 30S ribosomal protein S17 [candidate division Zixibacteria bacterium]|nr:30S ribosomal protein S17 [candidate division Zixibacteria bacterium]